MATICRFIHKDARRYKVLDLTAGRYDVGSTFRPPTVRYSPTIVSGTAANRFGQTRLADRRAEPRDWSFDVHIKNVTSDAELQRAISDIQEILEFAGDRSWPLYLEARTGVGASYAPTFGQGMAPLRYEVLFGEVDVPPAYGHKVLREKGLPNVRINLILSGMAHGVTQILGEATGSIREDTEGTVTGRSRGLIVASARTNEFVNPAMDHDSNWDHGWSQQGPGGTGNASWRTSHPEGVLFGNHSVRVMFSSDRWVQSVNVGNTNQHILSAFVKSVEESESAVDNMRLYYNGTVAPDYIVSYGNGWYRLVAAVTGVASSVEAGVKTLQALDQLEFYVDGFQLEEGDYETPFFYGEHLGVSWDGTRFESTSTRTAGRLRFRQVESQPAFFDATGTIRVIWKASHPSSSRTANAHLMESESGQYNLRWVQSSGQWRFNTQGVSASFTQGDIVVIHLVMGNNRGDIFVNGVGSTGGLIDKNLHDYWYIGSSENATVHADGTLMDFTVYPDDMSAAEVLADYEAVIAAVDGGGDAGLEQALAPIPYLWTEDGDGRVDNCYDSTRENYAVAGGIPGSVPADTIFDFEAISTDWLTMGSLWITNTYARDFMDPSPDFLFYDKSGSTGSGLCGNEEKQTAVGTTEVQIAGGARLHIKGFDRLADQELYIIARIKDGGSDLQIAPRFRQDELTFTGDYLNTDVGSSYRLHITRPLVFPSHTIIGATQPDMDQAYDKTHVDLLAKRSSTATTGTAAVDFIQVCPRPFARVYFDGVAASADPEFLRIQGRHAVVEELTGFTFRTVVGITTFRGDAIELRPGGYNILQTLTGDDAVFPNVGWTIEYSNVWVTPRYVLL